MARADTSSGRIVVISGPPGVGKSTVAERLATGSGFNCAAHLHTDDFYRAIRKGYVEPWLEESRQQNVTVMHVIAASASAYARGGYEVFVDGVIGPWFVELWTDLAAELDVRYIILRSDLATNVVRASRRTGEALTDADVVGFMWKQFEDLGRFAEHAIDTTGLTPEHTVQKIRQRLADGDFALGQP